MTPERGHEATLSEGPDWLMELGWEVLTGQLDPSLSGPSPHPHHEAQGGELTYVGSGLLKDERGFNWVVVGRGDQSRLREYHV